MKRILFETNCLKLSSTHFEICPKLNVLGERVFFYGITGAGLVYTGAVFLEEFVLFDELDLWFGVVLPLEAAAAEAEDEAAAADADDKAASEVSAVSGSLASSIAYAPTSDAAPTAFLRSPLITLIPDL